MIAACECGDRHYAKGLCKRCYERARRRGGWRRSPERHRAYKLMHRFGITVEEYESMLADQGGGCKLCGRPPKTRRLAVDHDHKTSKVRGLLCQRCNKVLGFCEDSMTLLSAMIAYLKEDA